MDNYLQNQIIKYLLSIGKPNKHTNRKEQAVEGTNHTL